MQINSNKASTSILGKMQKTQASLAKQFERIASGLRINQAADDAAGLAISSRFDAQIRGLNQATRNANDGVSMAQTADAALGGTTESLQRIRELSVQAGNGILTDSDRQAIQGEIDQLTDEINRVSGSTSFNGVNLLDGSSAGGVAIQVGANANETISVQGVDTRSSQLGASATVTSAPIDSGGLAEGDLSLNGVDVRATQDDGVSTANADASAIAVAEAINDVSADTGVTAQINATEVTGGDIEGGQLDAGNTLSINGVSITGDISADDAGGGLVDAINAASAETGVTASLNERGDLALTATDGRNIQIETTGTADAMTGLSDGVSSGTVTLRSDEQFAVAGAAPADAGLAAGQVGPDASQSIANIDVSTVEGANRSIQSVDAALERVGSARAGLGAVQNRFESTINNLSATSENLSAANSRIRDADIAKEMSDLVREQLLGQAQISMLAQSNTSQQSALRLLG